MEGVSVFSFKHVDFEMFVSHSSVNVQKAMEHESIVQERYIDISCNFGICYTISKLRDVNELEFDSGVDSSGCEV